MKDLLNLFLEGTISNLLPTLIGAFLGFFFGAVYYNKKEISSYNKQLDLFFIELTININQLHVLIKFINTNKENPKIYTSKEFLEINLWKNPIYNSPILDLKVLSEITMFNLAAELYQKVKNSEILYSSLKNGIFSDYDSIIKSINSLIEFLCDIAWTIYKISSKTELEFNKSNYNLLIENINNMKDKSKLKLKDIKL